MTRGIVEPEMEGLVRAYLLAKRDVVDAGFEGEITWQESIMPDVVTGPLFLREAAWVVLCSGMKERVVRRVFDQIALAMLEWDAHEIAKQSTRCRTNALAVFGHTGKVDAIIAIARRIAREGPRPLLDAVRCEGPTALVQLPYVGSTTCYHLAKNLGFQVPKPDRHLLRIAATYGKEVTDLCASIARALDEPVAVVDIVLWRYATIQGNYLASFAAARELPSA